MDALPECAWDAEHGLVVLYRRDEPGATQQDFVLALELAGGQSAYFAGDFPADRLIWAVKAPTEGSFRLLFYPLGPPARLDGEPLSAVPFDDQLRVDHDQPVGHQHRVSGWVFRAGDAGDGRGSLYIDPIEVPHGESLTRVLVEEGWEAGDRVGLTVTRYSGHGPDARRGPAAQPLRELGAWIDVYFTLVPDPHPLPPDAVRIQGFEALRVPAIIADLTPFGGLDESLRDGFCFIYRPHGPDSHFSHTLGSAVPVEVYNDGRRLLVWACDDACHLDQIGVYFSGGPRLRLRQDQGIGIQGYTGSPGEDCLVALYYGDDYLLLPTHAADFAARGRQHCAPLDMTELEIQLYAAWAVADARLRRADWRGAEDAGAFTLTAYADILAQILNTTEPGSGREQLPDLMARQGIGFRSFGEFARRPDFAFALFAEPRLQEALARDPRSLPEALRDERLWSPAAVLAAGLEPDADGLPRWIEDAPPSVQRAVWLFMLAGGAAADWRDLALPLAAADGDLPTLVRELRLARAAVPGYIAATLEDLGEDPGVLTAALRQLADAQARVAAIRRATAAVSRELERANRGLASALPGRQLQPRDVAREFSAALEAGSVPDPTTIRGLILSWLSGRGAGAMNLAAVVTELHTSVALWGLARLLGTDVVAPGAAFEAIDFASVPAAEAPTHGPVAAWGDDAPTIDDAPPAGGFGADGRDFGSVDAAPGPGPAADEDHGRLVLTWCLRVLRHENVAFPPHPGGTEPVDRFEVSDAMRDLEQIWGLGQDDERQALPQWGGARALEQRRLVDDLEVAHQQVRRHLATCEPGGDGGAVDPGALVERLVAARDCIAADTIWSRLQDRAEALLRATGDSQLSDLRTRMGRSPAPQWEALAAQFELREQALCAPANGDADEPGRAPPDLESG